MPVSSAVREPAIARTAGSNVGILLPPIIESLHHSAARPRWNEEEIAAVTSQLIVLH